MDRDFLFKLTNGIYRVTELFPKEEPLRFKIREKALDIFEDFILASPNPGVKTLKEVAPRIGNNINIMMGFFDLAEAQGWVDDRNFLVLEKEYGKVKQYLQAPQAPKNGSPTVSGGSPTVSGERFSENSGNLTPRQGKIVDFLNGNGGAPTREILQYLGGGMTKRTLRRELGTLVQSGAIERAGSSNQIYYKTCLS